MTVRGRSGPCLGAGPQPERRVGQGQPVQSQAAGGRGAVARARRQPIEKMWSKLKQFLRKVKARTEVILPIFPCSEVLRQFVLYRSQAHCIAFPLTDDILLITYT